MKIAVNKECIVNNGEDGTIVLIPKIEDLFAIAEDGEFYQIDAWEDMPAVGAEVLDEVWQEI